MCPTVISGRDSSRVTTVSAKTGQNFHRTVKISYTDTKPIGNGSFGSVFQARLMETGEFVAIKTTLQNKNFKNRELQIMQELNHCNIVKLKYFFYTSGKEKEVYLNLVMELVPATVYKIACQYSHLKKTLPMPDIKLYMYQLFRSLAYLHSLGICHRDIKPQNLLVNTKSGVLKLCDFGSAKILKEGETNVSYICSRYYRAPEILFRAEDYTRNIDVWSAGCVLAELMLGKPIFMAESGVDQLVEIIKVLGTPTVEEIVEMNKNYNEFDFPQVKAQPWHMVFKGRASHEAIDLVSRLLKYSPSSRMSPLKACAHSFFNELREPGARLSNNKELPPLFNFTEHELKIQPDLNHILIPPHLLSSSYPPATEGSEGCSTSGMMVEASNSVPMTSTTAVSDPKPGTSAPG